MDREVILEKNVVIRSQYKSKNGILIMIHINIQKEKMGCSYIYKYHNFQKNHFL